MLKGIINRRRLEEVNEKEGNNCSRIFVALEMGKGLDDVGNTDTPCLISRNPLKNLLHAGTHHERHSLKK